MVRKRRNASRPIVEALELRTLLSAVLYATDTQGLLYTVNTATGTTHVVGNTGVLLNDIAFSPDGRLFAVDESSNLYQLNPQTAAATEIGPLGITTPSLVFSPSGTLFTANSSLYTVDTSTGAAHLVGNLGGGFAAAGDLAFDNIGNLFVTTQSSRLVKVNPSSGQATAIGLLGFSEVFGLAFGPDNVMYGFSNTSDCVISINLATGAGTRVSGLPGVNGVFGADTAPNALTVVANNAAGIPVPNATLIRSDSSHNRLDSMTTDSAGSAIWLDISPGNYTLSLYAPNSDYWGDFSAAISAGQHIQTLQQHEPYETSLRVFSGTKDVTGTTVPVKKPLRFLLSVYNPAATRAHIRADLTITNTTLNSSSGLRPITTTVPARGTVTLDYSYTPTTSGVFNSTFHVQAPVGRTYVTTDSAGGVPAITVATTATSSRLSITPLDTSNLLHGSVSSVTTSIPTSALVKVNNKLSLFLNVDQESIGSATAQPVGLLAGPTIVPPEAAMNYHATFTHPGDQISVTFTMGITAGIWNILDVLLGRTAIPSPSAISAVLDDLATLPSLQQAYRDLTQPSGSTALQALGIINDVRGLLTDDIQAAFLVKELGKIGFKVSAPKLLHVLNIGTYYGLAKQLISLAALHGQLFSGFPIEATFTAAPVRSR